MNTLLDNCFTLFFNRLEFDEKLSIYLSEGRLTALNESVEVAGQEFKTIRSIEHSTQSDQFLVQFDAKEVVHFQVIDETFTAYDKDEIRDSSDFISIYSKSKYLDYIKSNHAWYQDLVQKEARHYMIWTEDQVIDVLSTKRPRVIALGD